MPTPSDNTRRFTDRVENYIRYRPGYPAVILGILQENCGLSPEAVVADIGSGTGLLTQLFLDYGCHVYGVEPNFEMRQAGEKLLAGYDRFTSVAATAEATSLPSQAFDFVTAGQAFHWFDIPKARQEFLRILKPAGWVVLVWNERQVDASPFLMAYEELLRTHSVDYEAVNHRQFDIGIIRSFYDSTTFQSKTLANFQEFDLQGLRGRVLSSSYVPLAGHPNFLPMQVKLEEIFHRYQVDGKVRFEYNTQVYFGRLGQDRSSSRAFVF